MTDRRVFVSADDWSSESIVVRGEQAHHLRNVLRARPGDSFEFIDGQGRWARATLKGISTRGELTCRIEEQSRTLSPGEDRVVLLQALVRFEKFEWILEKAAELGVNRIVPVVAAHTELKWRDVTNARQVRWEKILIESIKQCRRLYLPVLDPPLPFAQAVSKTRGGCKLLLSEKPGTPLLKSALKSFLETCRHSSGDVSYGGFTLAIGPEGGWADEEIGSAGRSGFQAVSLGEGILRAETATVAALAILHYETGN
ncbi:MAG: RsmE family RNA methyltransferase [Terriglobia bacterium]